MRGSTQTRDRILIQGWFAADEDAAPCIRWVLNGLGFEQFFCFCFFFFLFSKLNPSAEDLGVAVVPLTGIHPTQTGFSGADQPPSCPQHARRRETQ